MSATVDFLSCLLARASGPALLWDGGETRHTVTTRDEIEAAIEAEALYADLLTADGEIPGMSFGYETDDEVRTALDRFGPPSLLLVEEDEGGILVYLLDEAIPQGDPRWQVFRRVVEAAGGRDQFVPLVGLDGWTYGNDESEEAVRTGEPRVFSFAELVAKCQASRPAPAVAPAPEAEPAPAADGLERVNDAVIHGELPIDELTAASVELAFAPNREAKVWKNTAMTAANLVTLLTSHKVGEKDGRCFLTGATVGNVRSKSAIKAMYLLGIDVDSGASLADAVARLEALGLSAVVYTTHSHLKARTEISQTAYTNWCRKKRLPEEIEQASVREYLADVRGYTSAIVETCEVEGQEHTERGIQILIAHAPMPKFRVIFPLATPYVFAEQRGSHQETIKKWGELILGVANLMQVRIDQACLDPSRLFYLPRHPKGNNAYEIHITGGKLLDLASVTPAREQASADADPFAAAGAELGGGGPIDADHRYTPGGVDLWRWNREEGEWFEMADAIRDHAPHLVRVDQGTKVTIACPNDGAHSNPGDEADPGCFTSNAGDNPQQTGFTIRCSHNSCVGMSKSQFVCMLIQAGDLPESVLFDRSYSTKPDEEREPEEAAEEGKDAPADDRPKVSKEASLARVRDAAKLLDKATTGDELGALLLDLARCEPSRVQAEEVLKTLKVKTGTALSVLRDAYRDAQRSYTRERADAGEEEELPIHKDKVGRLKLSERGHGFTRAYQVTRDVILADNRQQPRLFLTGDRKVRFTPSEQIQGVSGQADAPGPESRLLDADAVLYEVFSRTSWWAATADGNEAEVGPPIQVARMFLADPAVQLPALSGQTSTPFFDQTGKLVTTPGYDWTSGIFYSPKPGFELPPVSARPSPAEVLEAREFLIGNVFVDFPFDDDLPVDVPDGEDRGPSSRTHIVCALLQFFMRSMIQGPTPLYFVTKPMAGTGANLIMDSTMMVAFGQPAQAQGETTNQEEMRKLITTKVLASVPYIFIDNINKPLDSGVLASAITSNVWTDRALGGNIDITAPIKNAWFVAGNNLKPSEEIARRCVPIRLDARTNPTERAKEFKHPQLMSWVTANRAKLVWACLTLIQSWACKPKDKRPVYTGKMLPSFEVWSATMGSLMLEIGMPGFLSNLHVARNSGANANTEWEMFVGSWMDARDDWDKPSVAGDPESSGAGNGDEALLSIVDRNNIDLGIRGVDPSARTQSLIKLMIDKRNNVFKINGDKIRLRTGNENRKKVFWLEKAVD